MIPIPLDRRPLWLRGVQAVAVVLRKTVALPDNFTMSRSVLDLMQLTKLMIPQYGRSVPAAQVLFQRFIAHRTQVLVRQGLQGYAAGKRQARSEFWCPLACLLLRAAWQYVYSSSTRSGLSLTTLSHQPSWQVHGPAALLS